MCWEASSRNKFAIGGGGGKESADEMGGDARRLV